MSAFKNSRKDVEDVTSDDLSGVTYDELVLPQDQWPEARQKVIADGEKFIQIHKNEAK